MTISQLHGKITSHWRYKRLRECATLFWPRIVKSRHGLPEISLDAITNGDVALEEPILDDVCMPRGVGRQGHDDLTPLLKIVRGRQPRIVLELGTAHGTTTANICRQSPQSRVYTVNSLPAEQSGKLVTFELSQDEIGRVFRAHGFAERVVQIYENTMSLDLARYLSGPVVDLAIIDACHDTRYVISDFEKVVPFLREGAVVLLHDTHPSMEGHLVGSYLGCMFLRKRGYDIRHLTGTWWGVFRKDADSIKVLQSPRSAPTSADTRLRNDVTEWLFGDGLSMLQARTDSATLSSQPPASDLRSAKRPNLFVIGASKCGTTSLHDYLAMHPDILMSTHKEPGYFVDAPDRDGCLQPAPGTDADPLDLYLRLFPDSDAKRYVGESSTNYTLAPRHAGVPQRIARFCPDARLIYIVRDPVERTISHYWYWCLTAEEFGPSPLKAILRDRRYLDASYYAMQLREYLPYFPREQIHVMCVEDLLAAPAATMGDLFKWLGLSLPSEHSDERYRERKNVTPQVFAQARTLLHWKLRQSQTFGSMRLLIPQPLRQSAWQFMSRAWLTTRQVDRSKVDLTSTIEYLRELQLPQAREFEVLLGREFRQWRTLWEGQEPTAPPAYVEDGGQTPAPANAT